MTLEVILSRGA